MVRYFERELTKLSKDVVLPTFRFFASSVGVTSRVMRNWATARHPDGQCRFLAFFAAVTKCRTIQSDIYDRIHGLPEADWAIHLRIRDVLAGKRARVEKPLPSDTWRWSKAQWDKFYRDAFEYSAANRYSP